MKVCFFHSYMFLFEHLNYITSFDLFSLKKNVRYVVHFNDLFTDHELNEVHCKQFIVRLDDISKYFVYLDAIGIGELCLFYNIRIGYY